MRNLAKYPITIDEMCTVLRRVAGEHDKRGKYGDITTAALHAAADRLVRIKFANEPESVRPNTSGAD